MIMAFSLSWLETLESKGLVAKQVEPGPAINCSEKEFQSAVIALAKQNGWIVHHHFDSRRSEPGWPDLVLIRDGRLLIRELKTEIGEESPEQIVWLAALRSCGVDAETWRPSQWGTIAEILKRGRHGQ